MSTAVMDASTVYSFVIAFIYISLCCSPVEHINAELAVGPRPKLTNGGSSETLCGITTSDKNASIIISGGAHNCSVVIITEGQVVIQIRKTDFDKKTNFLFAAEYTDNSDRIARYVALSTDTLPQCRIVFLTNHIELNIRGNFQVELLYNQPVSPSSASALNYCVNVMSFDAIEACQVVRTGGVSKTICNPLCDSFSCQCTLASHHITCEKLTIDMNSITTVTLLLFPRNMIHLKIIANISSIQEDAFDGLEMILNLDLSFNELTILRKSVFRNLVDLQELLLNHNRLTTIANSAFDGLHSLDKLSVSSNHLVHLTDYVFQNLNKLSWLDVSENNLATLSYKTFEGLGRLNTLYLDHNKLTTLQESLFRNLVNLQELRLNNNYLTTITKGDFYGLNGLYELNIANNELTGLAEDVFQNLKNLTLLEINNNKLSTLSYKIFEGLNGLNTLYLAKNKLVSLQQNVFQNLSSLTEISLQGNRLQTLIPGTFQHLKNLFSLTLDDNSLDHLPPGLFQGLGNLFLLAIKTNKIKTLESHTFDGLSSLSTLILDNNLISDVEEEAFQGLHYLTHLFLSNNKLVSFRKHTVMEIGKYLSYLNLKNNSISEIEPGTFTYLPSLTSLLLQQNQIHTLPSDISKLESVHTFNISHNYLEVLPPLGNLHSLTSVDLRSNSLIHIKKGTFKGLTNQTKVYVDHEAICRYEATGDSYTCLATESVLPFFTGQSLLSTSLSAFTWILGFGSLFGNTFVVVWRCLRQGDEDAVQSLLIMNLALSDLLMGMYLLIIASADAYFGDEFPLHAHKWVFASGCDFAGVLSVSSSEASVFFVTLISIDRYIRVVHPHTQYRLRIRSTYFSTLVIWAAAFLISMIPLVLKKTKDDFYDMSEVCIGLPLVKNPILSTKSLNFSKSELPAAEYENTTNNQYSVYQTSSESHVVAGLEVMVFSSTVFLGINLVCFIAVLYCYSAILHIVCKMSKKIKRSGGREREIRMAAKMAVIVLTDCFCWMPIIIMGVLVQAGAIKLSPVTIAWTVTFILPVNSSVNPYLYSIIAVLAKQIKETKDRRSFKLRSTNTACQTGDTNETAVSLCNLVGIGVKKKSLKGPNLTECSEGAKMVSI